MQTQIAELEKRQNKLVEWSHLLVLNRNANMGSKPAELSGYIESVPFHRQSAVLTEKLADFYWARRSLGDSVDTTETALKRGPSPQQRIRLLMKCAERRSVYGPDAKAYAHYETLLKENSDYPDALMVYRLMLPLAQRMSNAAAVEQCQKEIKRLSPPPATNAPAGKP